MSALLDASHKTARKNLLLSFHLLEIVERFGNADIPLLVLKGPAIAASVYGDLSLRPFHDLDLLVRREDLPRAAAALTTLGYRCDDWPAAAHVDMCVTSDCERRFQRDGVAVELHWDVEVPYLATGLSRERLWMRAATFAIAGRPMRVAGPADHLLLLTTHGAKHLWCRLNWLVDVAELLHVQGDRIDFAELLDEAAAGGAQRMLLLGVALAASTVGAEAPEVVARVLARQRGLQELTRRVERRLLWETPRHPRRWEALGFHLRVRDNPVDRLRCLVRFAGMPAAADVDFVRLPGRLAFLYHAVRPLRLTLNQMTRAAAAVRRDCRRERDSECLLVN